MGVKLGCAKFQPSTPKGTFSKCGLNWGELGNMYVFQRKTAHISKTVRDRA